MIRSKGRHVLSPTGADHIKQGAVRDQRNTRIYWLGSSIPHRDIFWCQYKFIANML